MPDTVRSKHRLDLLWVYNVEVWRVLFSFFLLKESPRSREERRPSISVDGTASTVGITVEALSLSDAFADAFLILGRTHGDSTEAC